MTKKEFIDAIMQQLCQVSWHTLVLPEQNYVDKKEDFFSFFYTYLIEEHLRLFLPSQSLHHSPQERILEILLLKFELMTDYKEAISRLQKDTLSRPQILQAILCADYKFLKQLWQAHGLGGDSIITQVKEKGVFLISWSAFFVWLEDGTSDLSKTMAFIDKALIFGEKLAEPYA